MRNENLIAFSNHQFYGDKLITFPHAESREDQGVFFDFVPNGVYDRGGNRANCPEAERAVDVALQHIREQPDRSVGVVAFSISQADAIENVFSVGYGRDQSGKLTMNFGPLNQAGSIRAGHEPRRGRVAA